MKTNSPKSPQSSPVKRAKRARLPRKMWLIDIPGCAPCAHDIRTYQEDVPVHVLDASEAAHEQRVARGAEAIALRHGHPWGGCGESTKHIFRDDAAAVLKSIGLTPTK